MKSENIKLQIEQAELKKKQLTSNTEICEEKIRRLQKQIETNRQKVAKIDFFLNKLGKSAGTPSPAAEQS